MEKVFLDKIMEKAKKSEKVLAVALFGSSLKSKEYRDIDICIFLKKKYPNLQMSKIKLDLLKNADSKIDIQIFQQLPLYIRTRILKEGKILMCKDYDLLYEIAFETIKDFGFYKKVYDEYLSQVKNA